MSFIDPISLKLFVSVVDAGTIAAAAQREHLVPAAVSKRISEIERHLGVQLLIRTNKGVEPTAAGHVLCSNARRILNDLEQIPALMDDYASGTHGVIRIQASLSATVQFLPQDLTEFLKKYPKIELQIQEGHSVSITKLIAENIADVGVFTSVPARSDLQTTEYDLDRLSLCVPVDHHFAGYQSISFAQVIDEPLVHMSADSAIGILTARAAGQLNKVLQIRIRANSFDAKCAMISAGLGIGIMPDTVIRRSAPALALVAVPLTDEWAYRQFYICCRKNDYLGSPAALLNDHLHACAMRRRRSHPSLLT